MNYRRDKVAYRGFFFRTVPVARSMVAINFVTVAGTSLEWWNSSIYGGTMSVRIRLAGPKRTEAPVVMGTWTSKTMILAVKLRARGITSDSGHSTLPMFKLTGSMAVKNSVTLAPAAAHCKSASSDWIAGYTR